MCIDYSKFMLLYTKTSNLTHSLLPWGIQSNFANSSPIHVHWTYWLIVFHVFHLAQLNWSKYNIQLWADNTGLSPAEDMCSLPDNLNTNRLDFLIPQHVYILREISLTVQFRDLFKTARYNAETEKGHPILFLTPACSVSWHHVSPWAAGIICATALKTSQELVSVQKKNPAQWKLVGFHGLKQEILWCLFPVLKIESHTWLRDKGFLPWYFNKVHHFAKVECSAMHTHNKFGIQFIDLTN